MSDRTQGIAEVQTGGGILRRSQCTQQRAAGNHVNRETTANYNEGKEDQAVLPGAQAGHQRKRSGCVKKHRYRQAGLVSDALDPGAHEDSEQKCDVLCEHDIHLVLVVEMKIFFYLGQEHALETLRQPAKEICEIYEVQKNICRPRVGVGEAG
ncbi:MAG: hypothetical protein ABSF53_28085 [Terracidiphilus sp.]